MSMKAVVTGHSRGLGAAVTDALRALGVAVLGLSRQMRGSPDAPAPLEQVALDLADPDAMQRWLAGGDLSRFLAGADTVLLVNNAGVVEPVGPLDTQPADAVVRAVALNVTAPLLLSRAVLDASPSAREHRIVHVSSGAARKAYAGWSVYCATKAALDHHARAVAMDATPGLRICSLAPGVVDTDMQATLRSTPPSNFPSLDRFVQLKADGALVPPADAARALVSYLISASFGEVPVADLRELATG